MYQLNTIAVKNSQTRNSIPERVHQVVMMMCRTPELNMRDTPLSEDVMDFLTDASWIICSTYHTVLRAFPVAMILGQDMLFDIPYVANWT